MVRSHRPLRALLLCTLCATLAIGCSKSPRLIEQSRQLPLGLESHCAPVLDRPDEDILVIAPLGYGPEKIDLEPEEAEAIHRPPLTFLALPSRAQQTAEAIGVQPLLNQIAAFEAQADRDAQGAALRLLTARQQLFDRFLHVLFQVSEVAAELECDRARALELAVRLEEIENDTRNRRTIVAVTSEPIFHIIAASTLVFGLPAVAGGLEVMGNGIRLTFGLASGQVAQHEEMSHRNNFLREIRQGPSDPPLFPPAVWRFLQQPAKEGEPPTRRDVIVSLWQGHLGRAGSKTEQRRLELFFGSGGVYGVRDLRHRADMLTVLSAFVTLMIHDLRELTYQTFR